MTSKEKVVSKFEAYFRAHQKPLCNMIGVELEHFLVHKETMESYRYFEPNGQHDMLRKLLGKGWLPLVEEGDYLLGIEKYGTTITLEPGGQVEISLKTCTLLQDIEILYKEVLKEIYSVLLEEQVLVSIPYHPKTKIEDLPLLPKKRYAYMYEYFGKSGSMGRNMMKGTAATQVSIDYYDEKDFIKKFKAAYFIGPYVTAFLDSAMIFEGQQYQGHNLRSRIWENTDPDRSGMMAGVFEKSFGFAAYGTYLLAAPPIVYQEEGSLYYTGDKTFEDLCQRDKINEEDIEHQMGMVFPDVRLKRYIEIRMVDALPYPYSLGVPALIKGLFYQQDNLDWLYELANQLSEEEMRALRQKAYRDHQALLEETLLDELLARALQGLPEEEHKYLAPLLTLRKDHGSLKAYLLAKNEAFYQEIIVEV